MKILVIEPWLAGSHRSWAEGYRANSRHRVDVIGLPGRYWRWRLRGGSVPLASALSAWVSDNGRPDILVVSGLVDVAQLLGLTRRDLNPDTPVVVYQHESQLVYPGSRSKADVEAALHNWMSWCVADRVWFNSAYHRDQVVGALDPFLRGLPDLSHHDRMGEVVARFEVAPVGVDDEAFAPVDRAEPDGGSPIIVWPHRWEADKDPAAFARALARLDQSGVEFRLVLAGEDPRAGSPAATEARRRVETGFAHRVSASGPFDRATYLRWLTTGDLVVSCARHEFFGLGVAEAMAAGCLPLLPDDLAYPELVPASAHEWALYEPGTFGASLVEAVGDLDRRRRLASTSPTLSSTMRRFAWSTVAADYDRRLDRMR